LRTKNYKRLQLLIKKKYEAEEELISSEGSSKKQGGDLKAYVK